MSETADSFDRVARPQAEADGRPVGTAESNRQTSPAKLDTNSIVFAEEVEFAEFESGSDTAVNSSTTGEWSTQTETTIEGQQAPRPLPLDKIIPAETSSDVSQRMAERQLRSAHQAPETVSPSPPARVDRPGWFRGRKQAETENSPQRVRQPRKEKIRISVPDEAPLPWKERARNWIAGIGGWGFGSSLLLHILILLALSFWIIRKTRDEGLSLVAHENEGLDTLVDGKLDLNLLPEGGAKQKEIVPAWKIPIPIPQKLDALPVRIAEQETTASEEKTGEGEGEGDAKGGGASEAGKFSAPKGGKGVVSKGSFTAWTVPRTPQPFQAYVIIIQVRLPSTVKTIQANDLSGRVEGTDDHRQLIPWDRNWPGAAFIHRPGAGLKLVSTETPLPIKNRVAELRIRVPGSPIPKTADTIVIESKLLEEKAGTDISLRFQSQNKS